MTTPTIASGTGVRTMTAPADTVASLPVVLELLDKHIQRCRDAVAMCPKWSPAQAEWSRARDALLNFRDDLDAVLTKTRASEWNHILEDGSLDHEWVTESGVTFCKHCELAKPLEGE